MKRALLAEPFAPHWQEGYERAHPPAPPWQARVSRAWRDTSADEHLWAGLRAALPPAFPLRCAVATPCLPLHARALRLAPR